MSPPGRRRADAAAALRRFPAGGEVRTGEMPERRQRQIAIGDVEAGGGLAQAVDDGRGNLAADGVGAENAGVEMQKFHGRGHPLV